MSDEQVNQTVGAARGPDYVPGTDPVATVHCSGCQTVIDTMAVKSFAKVKCPACGAETDVPAKFGHFLLLKRLGAGGMGTVFLAQDTSLGRRVAIKMMQKTIGDNPASFETFRNEAQSAAKLNHPHVAQIYSFGQQKGVPYLEMELVAGSKLEGMITDGIKLDPAFVMRVGLEIAEGLRAAEGVGLFHGDIKPDNILFDENMHAKLVDFGIASLASQGRSNELWGTPYYIAPEKVQKKKNSARSDIYSLGATLYHAIAAEPPYEGEDAVAVIKARFSGPPKPLEELRPDIEPEVARIIGRMMYNDLFMRYPNYGSLINDIKNYLASVPAIRKQGPLQTQGIGRKTVSSPNLTAGDLAPGSDVSASKPGKKFVIQKGAMEAQAALAEAQASPSARMVGKSAEPQKQEKKGGMNGAKVVMIIICVGLLLLLVGGGVLLGSVFLKNSRAAKATQANAAKAEDIETKYFGLEDELGTCLNMMKNRDSEMTNMVESLKVVYEKATGGQMIVPDFEPPPPALAEPEVPVAEVVAQPAAAGSSTNAPATAAPSEKREPLPPLDPELELKARIELKKLGEPDPNREMLELMVKKFKMEAAAAAPAAEATPAPVAEAAPEPVPAAEAAPEPEVAAEPAPVAMEAAPSPGEKLQRAADEVVFVHAKSIRASLRRCEEIFTMQPEVFSEIKQGMTAQQAKDALDLRSKAYEERMRFIEEMNRLISSADAALKSMKQGILKLEKESQKLISERDQLAKENAEAEAKAREEAEVRIKLAKTKAVADDEVVRVQEVLRSKSELVSKFDYGRIAVEMQRMDRELTTDAAREELKWTIVRFNRLADLRKFLIADLKKNGLVRRAYRNFDIRGISDDGKELIVPMRKGITIESLTIADWIRLIGFLLESRPYDRPIGTVEYGDQLFNAAIFCYVHSEGNEVALNKARVLAAKALEKRTSLKADAEKLIPILAEPPPAEPSAEPSAEAGAEVQKE